MVEWWNWAVLGFSLLALDLTVLNLYYPLWFGIAALVMGVLLLIFPDMALSVQILVFCGWSVALLMLWVLMLRPQQWKKARAEAARQLPGQSGVIINFNPTDKTGDLRLQRPIGHKDVWRFVADFDPRPGDRVMIERLGDNDIVELAAPRQEQD